MTAIPAQSVARKRAGQLLRFLKAYAERNVPTVRRTSDQQWSLYLRDLPQHESIYVGEVELTAADATTNAAVAQSRPLLSVRRPTTTECPAPPSLVLPWIEDGWRRLEGAVVVRETRNEKRGDETVIVRFEPDLARASSLHTWKAERAEWVMNERPARAALKAFEDLYNLRTRVQAESERVELVLGDGRLRWRRTDGETDHSVLFQRVDLEFLSEGPEIRVVDAERAPELATGLLASESMLSPADTSKLRDDLEARGYHPLERVATSTFLKGLARSLHAHGQFDESHAVRVTGEVPHISRDPVLFLRVRQSGFAAAFARISEELEREESAVPLSISLLTGVDQRPAEPSESTPASPWGEPRDVLLSKPANAQQVQIARALEAHKAVLVQGPPGTGKSHTISNLIGHLVAQGKRVLVTSQTTKALRVLRGHVVESVQSLCVSVLESDLDSRKQMEGAVRGILGRLTESTEEQLAQDVGNFAEDRSRLLRDIEKCTADLRDIREGEYALIHVEGESKSPADAARWLAASQSENDWIPERIAKEAPLPLSEVEVHELYSTNTVLSESAEAELSQQLPCLSEIPSVADFEELSATAMPSPPHADGRWWTRPVAEVELPPVTALRAAAERMARSVTEFAPWQLALVAAGHESEAARKLWLDLEAMVMEAHGVFEQSRSVLTEHECQIAPPFEVARCIQIAEALRTHVESGGGLGAFALLWKSAWKSFIGASTVNGHRPTTVAHFAALRDTLIGQTHRHRLIQRWMRQAVPVGLPDPSAIPEPLERNVREYVDHFARLLGWWESEWKDLEGHLTLAGFDWSALREHHVASSDPLSAFARDIHLVRDSLSVHVRERLAQAQHERSVRVRRELDALLAPFRGQVTQALAAAVSLGNANAYRTAYVEYQRLLALRAVHARRRELLARLETVAPAWATALRRRSAPHHATCVPGQIGTAWRWRQYAQEVSCRAGRNEQELTEKLHQLQRELRGVTSKLIDRRAWLGQIRRIDLASRQALQGWADVQKKIGKGTGKRVPELQAEARRLLAKARNAVPVWIMPLNRVADSMDLSQGRFDVVIVDEASQSDAMGLLAWFLGDRICVVGDHEQVSPLAVGQKLDEVSALIEEHLTDIPNAKLYDGKTSIYDLARQSFGATIALREHFRCVPDIIDFSNYLSYDGEILPLRDPTRATRPHVVEFIAPAAFGSGQYGKVNEAEARSIAALLKAAVARPEYTGKSFGAITLLGDEQAELIQRLSLELIGAGELDARRFVAGNAAQFQGDERDVMYLSMVHSSTGGVLHMRQDDPTKQRFNVAASRARDQLWLVHSLDPNRDLQQGDLRRRLIEHIRNPAASRDQAIKAEGRAESPFELDIIRRLVSEGFHVEPQVWVGRYRLDMVVRGGGQQVAVECDGDRFHGFDQIPADLARQAVLERVGWRFARIRGTRFYRHPDEAMGELRARLTLLGVTPDGAGPSLDIPIASRSPLIEQLHRDAWQIARDADWIMPPDPEPFTIAGTQ